MMFLKEESEVIKSDNNYLQEIILSNGSLENEVDELEINAKTEDSKALVVGNGKYIIEVGNNLIKLDVTAENGNIKEYTINVLRKERVNDDNLTEDIENEKIEKDDNSNKKVVHLSKHLEVLFGVVVLIVSFGIYIIKKQK